MSRPAPRHAKPQAIKRACLLHAAGVSVTLVTDVLSTMAVVVVVVVVVVLVHVLIHISASSAAYALVPAAPLHLLRAPLRHLDGARGRIRAAE